MKQDKIVIEPIEKPLIPKTEIYENFEVIVEEEKVQKEGIRYFEHKTSQPNFDFMDELKIKLE